MINCTFSLSSFLRLLVLDKARWDQGNDIVQSSCAGLRHWPQPNMSVSNIGRLSVDHPELRLAMLQAETHHCIGAHRVLMPKLQQPSRVRKIGPSTEPQDTCVCIGTKASSRGSMEW